MEAKNDNKIKPKHNVTMESRSHIHVTGVQKVVGSSDKWISLVTSDGALEVSGSELKITSFSEADGTLVFGGRVNKLEYAGEKKPLLKRIFR